MGRLRLRGLNLWWRFSGTRLAGRMAGLGWIQRIRFRTTGISPGPISDEELMATIGHDAVTIVEIGAHIGLDTARFLRLFPSATVFAFEPDPRNVALLRGDIDDPRVHVIEAAVSDSNGRQTLHLARALGREGTSRGLGGSGSSSLMQPGRHLEEHPLIVFDQQVVVETVRLDTWADREGLNEIDFVWADVQGAEGHLIRGGVETLRRTRWLFTEYSNRELFDGQPTLEDIKEMLPFFEVARRFPGDVLLRNTLMVP